MSEFDPADYARFVAWLYYLRIRPTAARYRTIAGRAYYSAYGRIRQALIVNCPHTEEALFSVQRKGKVLWMARHGGILNALKSAAEKADQFVVLQKQFETLWTLRIRADYKLSRSVTRSQAKLSMNLSKSVIGRVQELAARDYQHVPFGPPA